VCLVINENNIKAPLVRGAVLPQARLRGSKNKIQLKSSNFLYGKKEVTSDCFLYNNQRSLLFTLDI